MLRIGGGTLNPLELHDCELAASTDILSTSAAPESAESLPGLQADNGALADMSDWLHAPCTDRIDGVDDAFWCVGVVQLFGEKNILSDSCDDDSGSFLMCGDSFKSPLSMWFWLMEMFEPSFFFSCGPQFKSNELSLCEIFAEAKWFCSCLKFFSDPSKSRRRDISFLMSFKRSRSAAKVTGWIHIRLYLNRILVQTNLELSYQLPACWRKSLVILCSICTRSVISLSSSRQFGSGKSSVVGSTTLFASSDTSSSGV